MVVLLSVMPIRWPWISIGQTTLHQPRRTALTVYFGENFGDFLSLTRFATLHGGLVVISSPPRIIYSYARCLWKVYVMSVAMPPSPLVICFGLVQELSRSRDAQSFLAHSGRVNFIPFLIYYGSYWWLSLLWREGCSGSHNSLVYVEQSDWSPTWGYKEDVESFGPMGNALPNWILCRDGNNNGHP